MRPLIAAVLVCGAATQLIASGSALGAAADAPASIQVLSNRADLISGGDALVAVQLPDGVQPSAVQMTVGSQNVTNQFALGRTEITFTDQEWAALAQVFPSGVCDSSKAGVDQRPTIAWLTYQNSDGSVVYGGKPLGTAPPGSGGGWASRSFGDWLSGH